MVTGAKGAAEPAGGLAPGASLPTISGGQVLPTASARRPTTPLRRRTAGLIVVLVIAMLASVVFVALRADGREISRASSNDGGAWLVNRELGVVGHKNRTAGELSAFLRVTESPAADVHQAANVVVVHDQQTNQLFEVDARSFAEDMEPTQLPEMTRVQAVDNAVLVIRNEPLTVWRIDILRLPTLTSLDVVEPLVALEGAGQVAATSQGTFVTISKGAVRWHHLDGTTTSAGQIPFSGAIADVTIVDGSAIALSVTGDLAVIGAQAVEHHIVWADHNDAEPLVVLQQPQPTASDRLARPATHLSGMTAQGELIEIELANDVPKIVKQASLNGGNPLSPIVHRGCTYAVVTQPPTFGSLCDKFSTRQLDGAGQELRLRLVNGWVWVNDLDDGGTWVTTDDLDIEQLDDWGLAAKALSEDQEIDGPDSSGANDEVIVNDPNAEGAVQDDDEFDPSQENQPPVAVNDPARTRVDRSVVVPVLANDTDANNDILAVVGVTLTSGDAVVVITPSRDAVQVTPAPGFGGQVQVEYQVSDGRSPAVSATITVDVVSDVTVNKPPKVVTDVVATAPGHATTIDVLRNDSDPEGDALSLVAIEAPSGTLRWAPTGQITFTPDSTTEAGWIELPYVVQDDLGAENSTGKLRVEIRDRGANQEPDARNDQASTIVGRPVALSLLANDSDPDGDPLIVGSRPTVLLSPDGSTVQTSVSPDGEFVFSADRAGTYLFSYTATDAAEGGSERDTARIRVDVDDDAVNTPPIAVRDDVVIPLGEARIVYVLDNDGDPDGDVIGIVDWQSSPGLLVAEFADLTGHVGFRVTVAPDAPERPSFTYSISDGLSDPVSASVVVAVVDEGPRDQPPFASDDVIEARAGSTIEGLAVLSNDFDPEGGALRIVGIGDVDDASVEIAINGQSLILSIPSATESSFSIPYDIEDEAGNRASAVVRVQLISPGAPNRPPTARTDLSRTVLGTSVTISALRNDSDPDADAIVLEGLADQPAHGSATIGPDGTITYRPDPTFTGTDLIRYAIVDAQGERSIGDVFIGVMDREGLNLPPIANDDAYFIAGSPVAIPLDVLENDFDPEGDPLRVIDVTDTTHGSVSIDEFGRVQFTPPSSMATTTTATFQYTIIDTASNQARATVIVTIEAFDEAVPTPTPDPLVVEPTPAPEVTPTPDPIEPEPVVPPEVDNQPPVAVSDDRGPIKEGNEVRIEVLENDFDPDGSNEELVIVNLEGDGRLEGDTVVVDAGKETVQLTYTIADAAGAEATGTITVVVTANQPPTVAELLTSTSFETSINLDLSDQVTDPDGDVLFFVCCDNIRGGAIDNVNADAGILTARFTPDDNFFGQAGFSYVVDDQRGHQVAGSVLIDVLAPENQPPFAVNNTVQLPQGATITVELTQLGGDPDGDPLQWTINDASGPGVAADLNGSTVILRAERSVGVGQESSFSYQVSDGVLSASGQVQIVVVEGSNEPPEVTDLFVEIAAGSSATLDLTEQATDPDAGDSLTFGLSSLFADPLEVALDGSVLQVRAPIEAAGTSARFAFTVTDTRGAETSGAVDVLVTEPSSPQPSAEDDAASTRPGQVIDIDALANDVDPLGEGLTIVAAQASQGTADIPSGAQFVRFNPGDFVGSTSISYTIRDAANREASGSIQVETVGPPDRPAPPDVTAESGQATISWTTPQSNGRAITGYIISDGRGETTQVGLQNNFVWTDLINGEPYSFTVTAVNESGQSEPSEPSLPVTPNQVPEAPAPPAVTFQDGSLLVTWSEPTNAGSEVTGYELEIGGSASGTEPIGTDTSFEWTGLTNGLEYTFRVRAENDAGFGLFSAPSPSEHPEKPPASPTIGVTARGNLSGSLVVNWTKPSDGGGDIIEYRIVSPAGNATVSGADTLTYDWQNLPNGEPIAFQIQARNRAGWGDLSDPSNTTVPCGVADQVTNVVAARGDLQAQLVFDEPDANGCAITGYVITSEDGRIQNSSTTSHPFINLDNGADYTFTVTAINEMGSSIESAASNPVRPAGRPICPDPSTVTAAVVAPQTIEVDWNEAVDNGAPVLDFEVDYAGLGFRAQGSPATGAQFGSLANGTSYSFSIRAVNDVGVSPTCWTASATTWDVPSPVSVALAFDLDSQTLLATLSGGNSAGTPSTGWNATWLGDPAGNSNTGTDELPDGVFLTIVEDGSYGVTVEICNAVGCVQATACCEDITLAAPPDQMDPPSMSYDWLNDDNFTTEVSADWAEPNTNGAPIDGYLWEVRRIGSSGNWTDFAGTNASNEFGRVVEEWPSYSTHPGSWSGGTTILWEFRIRAENSEGLGDWSEWSSITPPARPPRVEVHEGSATPCEDGDPPQSCRKMIVRVWGMGGNNNYVVDAEAVNGAGQSTHSGWCGTRSVTTNNYGFVDVQVECWYGFYGNDVSVIIDGYQSQWQTWDAP